MTVKHSLTALKSQIFCVFYSYYVTNMNIQVLLNQTSEVSEASCVCT